MRGWSNFITQHCSADLHHNEREKRVLVEIGVSNRGGHSRDGAGPPLLHVGRTNDDYNGPIVSTPFLCWCFLFR